MNTRTRRAAAQKHYDEGASDQEAEEEEQVEAGGERALGPSRMYIGLGWGGYTTDKGSFLHRNTGVGHSRHS